MKLTLTPIGKQALELLGDRFSDLDIKLESLNDTVHGNLALYRAGMISGRRRVTEGMLKDLVRGTSIVAGQQNPHLWTNWCADIRRLSGGHHLEEPVDEAVLCGVLISLFDPDARFPDPAFIPFSSRGAIRDARAFHGRAEQLKLIEDKIKASGNCQIIGPRKMGKSSLLFAAGREVPKWVAQARFASVDLQDASTHSIAGFYAEVAAQWGWDASPQTNAEFSDRCKEAQKRGQRLVLAIDEVDRFVRLTQVFDVDFYDNLRAISQAGVAMLLAGRVSLREIEQSCGWVSPFSNITPALKLREFTAAEAESFVSSCPDVTFGSVESKAILTFAERHPCQLQIGCHWVRFKREFGGTLADAIAEAVEEWDSIKPFSQEEQRL